MGEPINRKLLNNLAFQLCQAHCRLYFALALVCFIRTLATAFFGSLRLELLTYFRKKKSKEHVNVDDVLNDVALTYANGFRDVRILINEAIAEPDTFRDEVESIIFELIAVNNYTYREVGQELGLSKKQVLYRYKLVVERVLNYLEKKGISSIEELL